MAFWFVFGIPALFVVLFLCRWASLDWRIERTINEIKADYEKKRIRVQQYYFDSSDWTG